jgi:hypothetical protein
MAILSLILLAAAAAEVPAIDMTTPPDFTISVNDGAVPIHCKVNEDEIRVTQEIIELKTQQVGLLRAHRFLDTLTPEQNQQLFEGELMLTALSQILAAHHFAVYYCKHPEALPKIAQGPAT